MRQRHCRNMKRMLGQVPLGLSITAVRLTPELAGLSPEAMESGMQQLIALGLISEPTKDGRILLYRWEPVLETESDAAAAAKLNLEPEEFEQHLRRLFRLEEEAKP